MKENNNKILKIKEKISSQEKENVDNIEIENYEESYSIDENSLGELEPIINEINQLEDEIEDFSDQISEEGEGDLLIENQKILDKLHLKTEIFLKSMSEKLAQYPRGVAESFRDRQIGRQADHLSKSFSKIASKIYKSFQDGSIPKQKIIKSFKSEYQKSDSLFKKIESGNWGNSPKKDQAVSKIENLFNKIIKGGLDLELYNEVINTLGIYENSSPLFSNIKIEKYNGFNYLLEETAKKLHNYLNNDDKNDEKISEICKEDPYLTIKFCNQESSFRKKKDVLVEKSLDEIIEKHPISNCNQTIYQEFLEVLNSNPDKYGMDPKNSEIIFNIFRTLNIEDQISTISRDINFFEKHLKILSEEDIDKILDKINTYDLYKERTQLILSFCNLTENNLKKLYEKMVPSYIEDEPPYSKRALIDKLKEETECIFIPLLKHTELEINQEEYLSDLKKISRQRLFAGENGLSLLIKLLSNTKETFKGISDNERDEIIENLIENYIGSDIKNIRKTHILLSECDIPLGLKEKINEKFSEKLLSNNYGGSSGRIITNKVFGENNKTIELSRNEEWLTGNKEILKSLEIELYKNGDLNDFRHFFYDVIEGKRISVDPDLLYRKYAERFYDFKAEEFMDLFVVRKKIPINYADIFIKKLDETQNEQLFFQLSESVRLGQISNDEYKSLMINMTSFGDINSANKAIDICLEKKMLSDIERNKIFETFIENIVSRTNSDSWSWEGNKLFNLIKQKYTQDNLKDEEKTFLCKKFFEEILKYENIHSMIISQTRDDPTLFEAAFKGEKEKEEFIDRFLVSNDKKTIKILLQEYFYWLRRQQKIKQGEINNEKESIVSKIDDERLNNLLLHALSLDGLNINTVLMGNINLVSKDKRDLIIKSLLSKKDILSNYQQNNEITNFCNTIAVVGEYLEDDNFLDENGNKKEEIVSKNDITEIFNKIFESKHIIEESFETLLNYYRRFLKLNKDILNKLISSAEFKNYSGASYSTLTCFQSENEQFLSNDQIKKLSTTVLKNKKINADMYQMYLDSTESNVRFYLDQELLDKNIKEINFDAHIKADSLVDFFILQRETKKQNNENKSVFLTKDQEELMIRGFFNANLSSPDFVRLFNLDQEMFRRLLSESLENNAVSRNSLNNLIMTEGSLSIEFFDKIIDNYFKNYVNNSNNFSSVFENICSKYGKNEIFLKNIKDKINEIPVIENRSILKSMLLKNDLMNPDELKNFYEDIRGEKNVHSQVLLSAEILGSMVCIDNDEMVEKFFNSEEKETKENIKHISNFVKKYSQESKGRTIAVMLFSKEYLPDRNINEVIKKVSETLSKYEKVLDNFKYEGIPQGLKASIGLEYEITNSTASGYKNYKERDLKSDIVRLSQAAHIGNGRDAVHEIATRPAINPYILLLEIQLLNDLEFIDFNFDRSEDYQKGARGYHVTIGGEEGLIVNSNTNFLQNTILSASWGGVNAGEIGKRVSGGRGVTLRNRNTNDSNNIKMFDRPTNAVELRSLSIDKMEQFQRAITTIFNGAIAIQALEKYTNCSSDQLIKYLLNGSKINNEEEFINKMKESNILKSGYEDDQKNIKIIYAWAELVYKIKEITEYHNNEFINGERYGYLDKDGVYVDNNEFGGEYNSSRFESVVSSIDPTLSLEEYVNSTKIDYNKFFYSFDVDFSDSLVKTNNLFLKPGNKNDSNGKITGGDQANAISMLDVTKFGNNMMEYRNDDSFLNGTVFSTLGERRQGYYYVQGGSDKMITHACQIALLDFNKKIEAIVN